ncbi:MAG TPA: hypothetical protein VGM03_09440 [Phycisphaerae bacterium]|jgi:hypothetical protein|nr:hypothetical protein [Terriglobales bacterium]
MQRKNRIDRTPIPLLPDLHRVAARWLRRSSNGDVLVSSLLFAPYQRRLTA